MLVITLEFSGQRCCSSRTLRTASTGSASSWARRSQRTQGWCSCRMFATKCGMVSGRSICWTAQATLDSPSHFQWSVQGQVRSTWEAWLALVLDLVCAPETCCDLRAGEGAVPALACCPHLPLRPPGSWMLRFLAPSTTHRAQGPTAATEYPSRPIRDDRPSQQHPAKSQAQGWQRKESTIGGVQALGLGFLKIQGN